MRYSDELTVAGRTFLIEASSAPPDAFDVSVRAEDTGNGPVEVRAVVPAGELTAVGEIVRHSLTGLARLAGTAEAGGGGESFKVRIAAARQRHPKAWMAWTPEEDERLLAGYRSGVKVPQLAEQLGRGPRAVISRLVKHGVGADPESADGAGPPASGTGADAG